MARGRPYHRPERPFRTRFVCDEKVAISDEAIVAKILIYEKTSSRNCHLSTISDINIVNRQADDKGPMEHRDLLSGFVRVHILHHASQHDVYGQWMMDELLRHGYRLGPGTLYPMLHTMERRGYLVSREEKVGAIRPQALSRNALRRGRTGACEAAAQGADGRAPKINR